MKNVLAVIVLLLGGASGVAQSQSNSPQHPLAALPAANLNAILAQIQQAVQSANTDIGRLHIDKWKTDADQKQQLHQMADSIQRNITNAMPGLISDVQTTSGNVSTTFKLYHNLNVLYEFLIYLADAAGSMTRQDEYDPLAKDASALDSARQGLSIYIEQAALKLESVRLSTPPAPSSTQTSAPPPPKKIVIDDGDPPKQPVKPSKKKTSSASPQPTPVPR
jgi:hypothetical protein